MGRRVWNLLCGKESPPASEDLREFFESSIKSAAHVGAQTAVSGAAVVAVKNGWIKGIEKSTSTGTIVGVVHVAMENAKILFKLAKGELSGMEALDAMGNSTASAVGGFAGAAWGVKGMALLGAKVGVVVGPIGAMVGGLVGGVVGGIAGSKIGEAVYKGRKVIVKTATKVVKASVYGTVETIKTLGRILNPLNWVS